MATVDHAFAAGWEDPLPDRPLPITVTDPFLLATETTYGEPRSPHPARAEAPTPTPPAPRLVSPLEAGTGICPQPGCTEQGSHIHRPDPATGRRETPTAQRRREAGEWSYVDWLAAIAHAGLSQAQALRLLRERVIAGQGVPPSRLAEVPRRTHLVAVLLEVLDEATRARTGGR